MEEEDEAKEELENRGLVVENFANPRTIMQSSAKGHVVPEGTTRRVLLPMVTKATGPKLLKKKKVKQKVVTTATEDQKRH